MAKQPSAIRRDLPDMVRDRMSLYSSLASIDFRPNIMSGRVGDAVLVDHLGPGRDEDRLDTSGSHVAFENLVLVLRDPIDAGDAAQAVDDEVVRGQGAGP